MQIEATLHNCETAKNHSIGEVLIGQTGAERQHAAFQPLSLFLTSPTDNAGYLILVTLSSAEGNFVTKPLNTSKMVFGAPIELRASSPPAIEGSRPHHLDHQ